MSDGLFPHFLKPNDIDYEKDFAVFNVGREIDGEPMHTLKEIGNPENPEEHRVYTGAIGALNGLYLKGYTDYESQLKISEEKYTFSRRKHATMGSGATDIFILNKNETVGQGRKGYVKQFAAVIDNVDGNDMTLILAPADFHKLDESKRSMPLRGVIVIDSGSWIEENGFGTRENAFEDIFRGFYSTTHCQTKFNIFSRVIRKSVDVTW